jgi:signal transduction histidine kinase
VTTRRFVACDSHVCARSPRRFIDDAIAGREARYTFRGLSHELSAQVDPNTKRQLLLIFKESVNNAVRHSGCRQIKVELRIDGAALRLEVADDGRGFDVDREYEGNGLESIRRRAGELGATLTLDSRSGRGTTVRLNLPLGRRKRAGRKP